ncbi:NYN domain-containing protein [Rivularia sp. UHCC 0363]|uniref:NYN domain-containing protein n=1 Tax=Rivularia sp. UHCC 0363 TaxID=3110244 RepID=UPI002B1F8F28|nr:NYN domain-containing protein [Rivularia sp. UHCC 0363]MEA5599485.1 NYN domain-containing protein [Rivularia sp. UHCC 0363]
MSSPFPPAVLLVDGYNIIGAWSCLKKTCENVGLEAARNELLEALVSYSAFTGYQTQAVFDAHFQRNCSNEEVVTKLVTAFYTDFGQTADTYIEKLCASLRHKVAQRLLSRVVVATSDRAQQLTVQGYGAEWISAQQLCCEIDTTVCRVRQKYKSRKKTNGRLLANSIDAKSRQRLAELRMGLK